LVAKRARAAPAPATIATGSDGAWEELAPPERILTTMIVDEAHHRLILFGGPAPSFTMSLDGPFVWQPFVTSGTPPSAGAFVPGFEDPVRHRALYVQYDFRVFALSLDDGQWSCVDSIPGPPDVSGSQVAFDPVHDRFISFGGLELCGRFSYCPHARTWELDLEPSPVWTELMPTGRVPAPRADGRGTYDTTRDRMLVFSGSGSSDTWALSLSGSPAWDSLAVGTGPLPSAGAWPLAYDRVADQLVVTEDTGQAWLLPMTPGASWQHVPPAGGPTTGNQGALVFDPLSARSIYYGGGSGETWAIINGPPPSWTRLDAPPPGRLWSNAVYDAGRDGGIVFGGLEFWSATYLNDLWLRPLAAGNAWSLLTPSGAPPPARATATAVFDRVGDRIVIFGGDGDQLGALNDVWAMAMSPAPAWSELHPTGGSPTPRWAQCGALDTRRRRLFVFGGLGTSAPSEYVHDSWMLSLDDPPAWIPLAASGGPASCNLCTAVYDSRRDRMLVFGNLDSTNVSEDRTWSLALSPNQEWTLLATDGSPGAQYEVQAMYDSLSDRMLIYSGDNAIQDNVWALDLSASPPKWSPLSISGSGMADGRAASAFFDSPGHRIVAFNARVPFDPYDLTPQALTSWAIDLTADITTPVALSLVAIDATPGLVTLTWNDPSGRTRMATVERRTQAGAWLDLATVAGDAEGTLRYQDANVVAGTSYAYRLVIGTEQMPETWVQVPLRSGLALAGLEPDPAIGEIMVAFSLPDAAPATIDLFDVRGRRVLTRDLGSPGAGSHRMRIAGPGEVPPGVYWLALRHHGERMTRRAVVLR
jgi:hypothetical protein